LETSLKSLKLEDIHTYYGNIHALKGINLEVQEGEVISLIGANGAGKSTTLMTTCGVVPAKRGRIIFEGREITTLASDEIVKLGICQVPEGRRIFPYLTVHENLDMGAFLRNDKTGIKQDLEYVYSLFPILADRKKSGRRHLKRRRTADAGNFKGPYGKTKGSAAGRTFPWACPHNSKTDF